MMRFTIIDHEETMTFLGPPHALKAIAACCAQGTATNAEMITKLGFYDIDLSRRLREQLAVFREHNTETDVEWIEERVRTDPDYADLLMVVSEPTRRVSLQPGSLGLIVFNLPARRIVQIANSYANLERADRGRVRRDGKATSTFYSYALPDDWTIVP